MKKTEIETSTEHIDLTTYTTEQMKAHILQHNKYAKKQQEIQQLLRIPEELNMPKELKQVGLELFGAELATLGQNRMALENHLCFVVKGLELGKLNIPNVHFEIDEIPCPSGAKHNHRVIKLWIEDQKTVLLDMISIAEQEDNPDA